MDETPEVEPKGESMDFALLPLGDRVVAAVPLRRMPQEAVMQMLSAHPGGGQVVEAVRLLQQALSPEDADRFAMLDFGDAMRTVQAYLETQVFEGYPSMEVDLDLELKELLDE